MNFYSEHFYRISSQMLIGCSLSFENMAANLLVSAISTVSFVRGYSIQHRRLVETMSGLLLLARLLGAGVLGDRLGALGNGVLGQFTGQ
uniref:TCP binding protein 2 n=1 Tax=Rattus norvegicus TaxID=10116 RepID=B2BF95_RAT|nr:TCP binding protein 2 [Rattus norvegicus]